VLRWGCIPVAAGLREPHADRAAPWLSVEQEASASMPGKTGADPMTGFAAFIRPDLPLLAKRVSRRALIMCMVQAQAIRDRAAKAKPKPPNLAILLRSNL